MIVELLIILTTALWTAPLLCEMPAGVALPEIFSIKQQNNPFDVTISKDKSPKQVQEDTPLTIVKHRHIITIFVHGTLFPIPSLTAAQEWAGERFKKNGHPASYSDLIRERSILRNQPIGPIGMHSVSPEWSANATGAQLLGWLLQEMYRLLPKEDFALVHPFTFGWDGSLNQNRRREQAKDFLKKTSELFTEYRLRYPHEDVEIVILAHSHGGNVALHMADWVDTKSPFFIDHLFMFGTPVHGDTQNLVISPLFKNVYNIHSSGDFIQIADVVSTTKYVPARVFKNATVLASAAVKQVQVEVGSYHPNHSELWFFRRPDVIFFRSSIPTSPLPIAAFTPLLLHEIKKTSKNEHFLKLFLDIELGNLHVSLSPFLDYWQGDLVRLHQYKSRFDFTTLFSKLPLIQNE